MKFASIINFVLSLNSLVLHKGKAFVDARNLQLVIYGTSLILLPLRKRACKNVFNVSNQPG